jgi:hypothetical protein
VLTGVALALSELPRSLIDRHDLRRRVHDRGGEPEVQFLLRDAERLLPVWHEGRLMLTYWGCRRGESRHLPCTAWTRRATVEAGTWVAWGSAPVLVPATLGLDRGVWYRVRQGVQGVLAEDEHGQARVYVVCEPASHYYHMMTRSDWMPVLVGERI